MSQIIKTKLATVAALLIGCACSVHAAGLDGANVDLSYYYPNLSSLYEDNGDFIVPAVTTFFGEVQVNVTDTQIIITPSITSSFTPSSFNGIEMTILSGPALTSAVVDPSSQFSPVGISIVGGDELLLNFQGDSFSAGEESIIDINSSVPDGGLTIAMLGSAMAGLAFLRRKF